MAASTMSPKLNGQGNVELPEFKLPLCRKNLWVLGLSAAGQDLLMPCLDPFDKFWVTDSVKEAHLSAICKWCDNNRDSSWQRKNILHCLVQFDSCVPLLERLLKLGLDPNVKEGFSMDTPGHVCSRKGNLGPLMALLLCRADPKAENRMERTANADAAYERSKIHSFSDEKVQRLEAVNTAWAKFRTPAPLSVAQLAAEGKWFALQNVCRRRVVPGNEKLAVYNGRNAIEWANYHGEANLAEELIYFLVSPGIVTPFCVMAAPAIPKPSRLAVQPPLPAAVIGTSAIQHGLKPACTSTSTSSLAGDESLRQEVKELEEELVSTEKREEELHEGMKEVRED